MAEILNSIEWLLIFIVPALAWIYCTSTHKIMEFGYRIIEPVVNELLGFKEIKDNLQQ